MTKQENMNFGDLELEVMSCLWDKREPTTVNEVHQRLCEGRELAYTTVLTVLSNLFKKGAVDRAKQGKAYVYWPKKERDQAAAGLFENLLKRVYGNNPAELLVGFLKTTDPLSTKQIHRLKEELERLEQESDG